MIQYSGIKDWTLAILLQQPLSRSYNDTERKTFNEFRLKPVAVNPWAMVCPCDLMAMNFLQWWSGESLSPAPATAASPQAHTMPYFLI